MNESYNNDSAKHLLAQIAESLTPATPEETLSDIREVLSRLCEQAASDPAVPLHGSIRQELAELQTRLDRIGPKPSRRTIRRLETQFYSMIDGNTILRRIYRSLIDYDVFDALDSRRHFLEEMAARGNLSKDETHELARVKAEMEIIATTITTLRHKKA